MDIKPPKRPAAGSRPQRRPTPQTAPSDAQFNPPQSTRPAMPLRPKSPTAQSPSPSPPAPSASQPSTIAQPTDIAPAQTLRRPFYRKWQVWILAIIGVFVLVAGSTLWWYRWTLQPIDSHNPQSVRVVIRSGETSRDIVKTLSDKGLIRSQLATRLYIDMSGQKHKLQAGGYVLSRNLNVVDIVTHIVEGKTDELSVTILPGLTLKELADAEVKGSLAQQGFDPAEIKDALKASYTSPLLVDRPPGQGLEGYLFPETYRMNAGDKLHTVIQRSLDELYDKLQTDAMIEKFKAHGLTIHQALTLASIVQKEVSDPAVQPQVAQVFYSRLATGMVLGSDVTFEYAAAQLGVTPAVDIASPYNTRQNPGLPPGPIANMNYSALQAIATPAAGDYLYFVAGDDGTTYFGKTFEEHQANIAAHCHDLCNLY